MISLQKNAPQRDYLLTAIVILLTVSVLVSCSKSRRVLGAHETLWKQNELLISYCCSAPPTEAIITRAATENFNMIPAWRETLDFAAKHKIKIMLEHGLLTPKIANDPDKLKELEQLILQVKDHPALESYYLFDEPKASDFAAVAKLVDFIRERDPKHFSFVNMLPLHAVPGYAVPCQPGVDPSKTYMQFLKDYITAVKPDLLSYDYYNFLRKPSGEPEDLLGYFVNLALGLFSSKGRTDHFMLVNGDYSQPVKADLLVEGTELKEFDREKLVWQAVPADPSGGYVIEIGPGDGRLFQFR